MVLIHKTAYPRLRSHYTFAQLKEFYTPDDRELAFAMKHTREPANQISLLVLLKVADVYKRQAYWLCMVFETKTTNTRGNRL